MSLLKEIAFSNGAVASYHRIKSISRDGEYLVISLKSYKDKTYRDKEKRKYELAATSEERYNKEYEIANILEMDRTEEQKKELATAMAEDDEYKNLISITTFEISSISERIKYNENDDDISFAGCYDKLKELPKFEDSEDC